MYQIGKNVFCVEGTAVNWIIIRDGRDLTLIDAGYPGDVKQLEHSIASLGHQPQDIRAVLVTHAHVDHVGALNHLHAAYGTPVLMHPDELPNALRQRHESATPVDVAARAWHPRVARWATRIIAKGATGHPVIAHAQSWGDDGALDLPGSPIPLWVPGHTSGNAAYLLADPAILISGDALVTGHAVSKIDGPQLLPDFFHHDPVAADTALDQLATVSADVIVPGHGRPWRGSVEAAVEAARATSPQRLR